MFKIIDSLIDANAREIKRLGGVVEQINRLETKVTKYTDAKLRSEAEMIRKKVQGGTVLDEVLVEVMALTREASRRINKERPYDVQLMASITLHKGKIAEQKTGEGKTLSAAPAVVLNAMIGRGVHVVTVNDYLARRDAGWMGPIYQALGLSTGVIIHDESFIFDPKFNNKSADDPKLKHLRPATRKEAYAADITYGTNNEFGFDYLRDNMARSLEYQNQRGHYFAIVDEVDSILIDEARTPLIISAPGDEPTDRYVEFTKVIEHLSEEGDYVIDEKARSVNLTERGILKVEKILGVENLYEKDFKTLHHLEEALKARTLFKRDRDYVVRDGEVVIVDEFTGRLMPGRRYSEGLHQAIEAKEGVEIQQETKTMASISFQNYFRMYEKLAGMTGTAATEAEEFHKIYKLDVIVIPTNKPVARQDFPDAIYKTQAAKYTAVADEVERVHAAGQPILVGTTSIDKNEALSELLKRKKISHALLNAKNHAKEAEIIAKAGQKGAVTVATNLAGRGVDIKLGTGVDKLGGLYVLGTERHESRRIDNQLRGRSGRQGDAGTSKFFVSLEDDLMRIFGGEQVAKMMNFLKVPDEMPIENSLVSRALESAQKKVEGHNFDMRKNTVEYDDVMNQQRKIIYGVRQQILEATANNPENQDGLKSDILNKIEKEIQKIVQINTDDTGQVDVKQVVADFCTIVPFDPNSMAGLEQELGRVGDGTRISEFISNLAREIYEEREKQVGGEVARGMEAFVYLGTMDELWQEHLDNIDDLRAGIGLRAYAQRDPLVEYKKEAFELFERLIDTIDSEVVHRIYKVSAVNQQPVVVGRVQEKHQEALDLGQDIREIQKIERETGEDQLPELTTLQTESRTENKGQTKVVIERQGQSPVTQMINENGAMSREHSKIGRNDPCWCGSGKKYKKCHYPN